jgi:hypothetical protein
MLSLYKKYEEVYGKGIELCKAGEFAKGLRTLKAANKILDAFINSLN